MIRLKCVRTLPLLGILLSLLPICTAAPRIVNAEPEPSTTTPPTASWIPKFFKQQLDLLNKVLAESGAAPIDKEDVGKIFATNNATSAAPQIASSIIASGPPPALSTTTAAVSAESASSLREMLAMFNLSSATTALPASFIPISTAQFSAPSLSSPAPSFAEATGTTPAAPSKGPADALREMLAMFNLSSQAPASANHTATTALPAPFSSMSSAPSASSNLPFPSAPSFAEASALTEAAVSPGTENLMPTGSTSSASLEFSSQTPSVVSATEPSSLLSPAAEAMTSAQPVTLSSNELQQPSELANVTGSSASKAAATTAAQQLNGEFSTVTPSAALEGSTMPEYPVQQAATEQPSRVSTSVGPQIEAPTGETTSALPLASGETVAPSALQQSNTTPAASAEGPSAEPSNEARESTRPSAISEPTGGFSESPGPGMKPTNAHSKQPSATSPANVQREATEGTEGAKQQTASEGFTAAPSQEVSGQFQEKHTTLPFSHVSGATGTAISNGQLTSSHVTANVTATMSPSKASSASVTRPHVESSFNATKSKQPALTGTSEAPLLVSGHPAPVSPSASPQIGAQTEATTSSFSAASGENTVAGEFQQSRTTPAASADAQSAKPSEETLGPTHLPAISGPASGSAETSGPAGPTATSIPSLQHETASPGVPQQETPESSQAAASHEVSGQFQGMHTTLPFTRVSGATGSVANDEQRHSSNFMANVTATKSPSKASSANATRPHVESSINATKSNQPALPRTSEVPPLSASEQPSLLSPSPGPENEALREKATSSFPMASGENTAAGELQQSLTTTAASAEAQSEEPSKEALGSTRPSEVSGPAGGSSETPGLNGTAVTSAPGLQHETAMPGAQQQETPESSPAAASHEVSGQLQGKHTTLPFSRVSGATASVANEGQRPSTHLMANVTATKIPSKAGSANVTIPHVESSFNATKSHKPALNATSVKPSLTTEHPLVSPSARPQIEAATGELQQLQQLATTPATSGETQPSAHSKEALRSTRATAVPESATGSVEALEPATKPTNVSTATVVPNQQNEAATQAARQQNASEGFTAAAGQEASGPFQGKLTTLPFSGISSATESATSSGRLSSFRLMANVTATKRPHKANSANVTMPHVESSFNATKGKKPTLNGTSEAPSLTSEHPPLVSPSGSPQIEALTEENGSASPIASGEQTAAGELLQSITRPATSAEAQSEEPSNEALGSTRPPEVSGPAGGFARTAGPNGPTAASLSSLQNEAATQFAHQHTVSEGLLAAASHGHSGPFQGKHTTLPFSGVPTFATGSMVSSGQQSSSHSVANATVTKSPHKASFANVTTPHVQSSFNATKGSIPALNETTKEQSLVSPSASPELEAPAEAVTSSFPVALQEKTAPGEPEQLVTPLATSALTQSAELINDATGSIGPSVTGSSELQGRHTTARSGTSNAPRQPNLQNETAMPETLESGASEGISPAASQVVSGQFQRKQTALSLSQQQIGATGTTIRYGQLLSSPLMSNVTTSNRPRKAISANATTPHVQSALSASKGSNKPALSGIATKMPSGVSEGTENQTAKPDLSAEQSARGLTAEPASAANVTRPHVQSSINATKGRKPSAGNATESPMQSSDDTTSNKPSAEQSMGGVTAAPAKAGLGGQNAEWKGTAPPGQELPLALNEGSQAEGGITPAPARGGIGGGEAPWKGTAPPGQAIPQGGNQSAQISNPTALPVFENTIETTQNISEAQTGIVKAGKPFGSTHRMANVTAAPLSSGVSPANATGARAFGREGASGAPFQEFSEATPQFGSPVMPNVTASPKSPGVRPNVTRPIVQGFRKASGARNTTDNSSITLQPGQEPSNTTGTVKSEEEESKVVTAGPARGGLGGQQSAWKGTAPPGQQLPPQVAQGGPSAGKEATPKPARGGIGGGQAPWKGTAPPDLAFPSGGSSLESVDNATVSSIAPAPSEASAIQIANGSATTAAQGRVKSGFSKNFTKSPISGNQTAVAATTGHQSNDTSAGQLTSNETVTNPAGSEITAPPARGGVGGGQADWKGTPPPGQQLPPQVAHGGPETGEGVAPRPASGGIGGEEAPWIGTPPPGQAFPQGSRSQESADNSSFSSRPDEVAASRAPSEGQTLQTANKSAATAEPGRVKSGFSKNVTKAPPGGNNTAVSEPPTGNLTSKELGTTPSGSEATGAPARGGIGGGEADWKGTPPPGQQFPGPQEPLANVTGAPANGGIGGVQSAWKGTAPPGQAFPQGGGSQQNNDNSTLSSQLNEFAISGAANESKATTEPGRMKSGFSKNVTKSPPGGNQTAVSEPPTGNLTSKETVTTASGSEATGAPARGGIGGGEADWKGTPPPGQQFPGQQQPLTSVTGAPASAGIGGVQTAWKGTAPPGQALSQGGSSQQNVDNTSFSSQPAESAISRAPNGSATTTGTGLVKSSGGRNATKSPASHDNATHTSPPQQSSETSPGHVPSGEMTTVPPGSENTAAPAKGGIGGGQAEWKGTAPPGQSFPQGTASSSAPSAEASLQSTKRSVTTAEPGRVKSSGGKNVTISPASQNSTASTLRQGQQSNDRSTTPVAFTETATAPTGSENTAAPARGGIGGGQADWKGTAPPDQAFPQGGRSQESIHNASVSSQPGKASITAAPSAQVTSARPLNGSATTAEQGRVKSSGGKNVTKSPTDQNETTVSKPSGHQLESEPSTSHLASTDLGTTPSDGEITGAPAKGGVGGGPADWKGTPPPGRQFPGPQEQLPFVTGAPARGGIGGVQSAWKGTLPPLPQAQLSASTANPNPLSGAAAFTQPQETLPHTGSLPQHPTVPSETPSRPSKTRGPVETAPGERLITAPPAAPAGPAGPIRPTQGPAQNIGQPPIERPSLPEEPSLPSHGGARPTNSNENAPRQPVPVPPSSTDQPESQLLQILINLWEDGRKRA